MISLNDDELRIVMRLAEPVRPEHRGAYLQDVAAALDQCPERGLGLLHRICVEAQQRHFDPPTFHRELPPRQFRNVG
jgi:hypothetical protein